MSGLADLQSGFLEQLLGEASQLPEGWNDRAEAGMQVYRGNYRSALVETIRELYTRTEALLGDEAFRPLAIHHAIAHPPTGWTIDAAGAGFADTLARLTSDQPQVAELAWVEWAMHEALTAADVPGMDAEGFGVATTGFTPDDWASLKLGFVVHLSLRPASFNLPALYSQLGEGAQAAPQPFAGHVAVWREGEQPVAVMLDQNEGASLEMAMEGATFAQIVAALAVQMDEAEAAQAAGGYLGHWLGEGWIAAVSN